jgi:2-C-methyl-D-erythritol 4-phosphate cytidylyltransferase
MNVALILAAGTGSRMGNTDKPKQFLPIYGKPLMVHTIEAFEINDEVDAIVISTNEEYIDDVKVMCKQYDLTKVCKVVAGGDTRQISVYNGLKGVKEIGAKDDDIIIIHDSARPLISQRIIRENIECCKAYGAVDTVIKATDTIVKSENGQTISDIPVRKELYQGQTPQTFNFSLIWNAHEAVKNKSVPNVTDDTKLVLLLGHDVHLVEGDKLNFKITTFDDLMMLKALLKIGKSEVL